MSWTVTIINKMRYVYVLFLLCTVLIACASETQPAPPLSTPTFDSGLQTPLPVLGTAATSPETISEYLVTTFGVSAYGGKVFCSYQLMGYEKENEERANLYLWVQCQEFYVDQESVLRAGSGISLPVVIYLLRNDAGYQIVESQHPGEGEAYANDVRKLFPQNLWTTIFPNPDETPPYDSYNTRAEVLYNLNQQSALLSFLLSEGGEWNIAIPLPVP